jgi:hypothetical protein
VNCIAETGSVTKRTPLPPKVIEVYTAVGKLLKHYKSGKLPRALKMMPHLKVRRLQYSPLSLSCSRALYTELGGCPLVNKA